MSLLCSNCRETYCRGDSTVAFESDGRGPRQQVGGEEVAVDEEEEVDRGVRIVQPFEAPERHVVVGSDF